MSTGPRVLVVGAGSIGGRHARNLVAGGATVYITDPQPGRADDVQVGHAVAFPVRTMDDYEGVVIASPTVSHKEQAMLALDAGMKVLVEKPLALTGEEGQAIVDSGGDRVMVGYNLRLHRPIELLMDWIRAGRIGALVAARFWFGSFLPDWRPGTDYRTCYSARSDLGGGVLLDAIHELDLILWLFEEDIEVLWAYLGRVGHLEIDVEDTVKAFLRHAGRTPIELSLDYLSRRYRRGVEVIGSEGTARLDWARGVLEVEDRSGIETVPADTPIAESYEREAARFLDWIQGRARPPVDGIAGLRSLLLADRIREMAAKHGGQNR